MTFGWLTSELIKRVTGKTLGSYFREEIAEDRDIDFYIGLPEAEEGRVAEMIPFSKEENNQNENTEPNDAQKASGSGPNLLKTSKHQSMERSGDTFCQWTRQCVRFGKTLQSRSAQ